MPAIYHEGSWLGNATDPEVLVKDTVGWTGKNFADNSKTKSMFGADVSVFSLNDNGGFSLSGSIQYLASFTPLSNLVVGEQYIASIKVVSSTNSDARLTLRNRTNQIQIQKIFGTTPGVYELPFTYQDGWYLSVICNFTATQSSMEIEEIMVRKADITDPTYEPYHESVEEEIEQVYVDNGVLGAKNLLNPSMTTQTQNGLTFTVNDDNTVTVNGTATASGDFGVLSTRALSFDGCILNGNPSIDNTKIKLIYYDATNGRQFDVPANDGEVTISGTNGDNCRVVISYYNGATVSNLTFKPMLRLASDPDDTYQPYAMTNRELTEKVFEKRTLTSADDLNDITETGIYKIRTAPVNSPESVAYATLIVCKYDDNDINQMIYRGGSSSGNIYVRSKGGIPSAWLPWYKLTGTVVS